MEDEKGKLIGLPYDYEYRGWKRERNRDFPLWKSDVIWGLLGFMFAVSGIIILIKSPSDIFAVIFCFAFVALMWWLIWNQHKKHNELLEIIKKYKL